MWACRIRSLRPLETLRTAIEAPWLSQSFCSYIDSPQKKAKLAPLQEVMVAMAVSAFDGAEVTVVEDLMNAGRGGHGTSKNKIGTRGADKVVHVPVGTVIHLLKGEIPRLVEKDPLADPDPWDLPGSLDTRPSESDYQSPSEDHESSEEAESQHKNTCSSYPGKRSSEDKTSMKQQFIQDNRNDALSCSAHSTESQLEGEIEEEEQILYNVAELKEKGQRVVIARGGEGGLGNVSLGKLSKDLKPSKHEKMNDDDAHDSDDHDDEASSSTGCPCSESVVILELKSIADVGLVGMPNAGKSTLLGAISRAKPSVGHYAFTTLRPNLGNVNFDDFSITVADIPGLIKGAHENRGLGHTFLRHIERTKVLAFVVDLASGLGGRKGSPPWEQLRDLILELEHHQEGLSSRPSLIVANKIDEDGAEEAYEELKRRVKGVVPVYPVCAVLEEGVPELKDGLKNLVTGRESYVLNINDIVV
ncbi:hypothetical protein CRG98_024447 [Punica granatum]|uniref:Uncharacterized protein n=1 Tax=Punica granatum TaxID=22663 RepID=A0A2I0JHR9_PUNGR|nr:hypothetical protein CRG98_024447 [Punica granatum]